MTEIIPWPELDIMISEAVNEFRKINSGVHMSMLATTRGGKTTLATGAGKIGHGILGHFEDVLVIDSTADPGPITNYGKPVNKFKAIRGHQRLTVGSMTTESREKIVKWINKAVKQKNVAIYVDEIRQLSDKKFFGLEPLLTHIWLFGAKQGTSLIGGTQAPIWVPSPFYDQAKLHFLFGIRDERRMKRLSEIGGDTETLRAVLPTLKKYEFAYVDLEGDVWISKFTLPKPPRETPSNARVSLTRTPDSRKVRVEPTRGRIVKVTR